MFHPAAIVVSVSAVLTCNAECCAICALELIDTSHHTMLFEEEKPPCLPQLICALRRRCGSVQGCLLSYGKVLLKTEPQAVTWQTHVYHVCP